MISINLINDINKSLGIPFSIYPVVLQSNSPTVELQSVVGHCLFTQYSILYTLIILNTQYSILFYLSRSFEFLCQLVYLPILVSHYLPKVLLACLLVFFWVHSVMIFTNLQSGICLSWKAHLKRCYLQNLIRSHDQ